MGRRNGVVRGGFTLIEVMIVIAIVLALTGLVAVNLMGRRDEAKVDTTRLQLRNIKNAMKLFRLDYDRWPTDEEGVAVLWNKERLDQESDVEKWKAYLEEPMPVDQWGNEWGYRQVSDTDETQYDLWSNGPDGQEGTEDDIYARERVEGEEGLEPLSEPVGSTGRG